MMFFHSFIYSLKVLLRQKTQLFWSLIFPIALGSMFFIAFSNLDADEQFEEIPVAVIYEEGTENDVLREVMDSLSSGDDAMFDVVSNSESDALSLLEEKKIAGIIYSSVPATLTISANMDSEKIGQSILDAFVRQYNLTYDALTAVLEEHPEKMESVLEQITETSSFNKETHFVEGKMDQQLVYFFNLIAMVCMFGSMAGCMVTIQNQANLSALGARRNCAPINKLVGLVASLCANILIQFACSLVCLVYLTGALNIAFGSEPGYIVLSTLAGCTLGVCFGFFIGALNHLGEGTKIGICVGISMICCFLSGLMVGSMRVIIDRVCPWFNHINPTALISDSLYALTVYPSHQRYFENLLIMVSIAAVFAIGGFFIVRRKKYASL